MTYNGDRLTVPSDVDPNSVVDAALAFVGAGIPVFPVWGVIPDSAGGWVCACSLGSASTDDGHKPGKHPATAHGHLDAQLVTPDAARKQFVESGAKNLAIPTGNNLVVFDFDPKNGGGEVYDDWENWTGGISLPPTLICETGSGGIHCYYQTPAGVNVVSRTATLPGLDVQSGGRYVVASSSRHISGNMYAWRDPERPVTTMPADLISWLMARRGGFGPQGAETPEDFDVKKGFIQGQRDAYANARAFQLRKSGISKDRAVAALRSEWEKAEQPPDDLFPWSVVMEKLDRVWTSVEPDLPGHTAQMWAAGIAASSASIAAGREPLPMSAEQADHFDGDTPPPEPPRVFHGLVVDPPHPLETMTEAGNSLRYARLFRGHALFVPEISRWLMWNGSVFAHDTLNQTLALTAFVAADIRDQVLAETDDAQRRMGEQWAMRSESMSVRNATRAGAALLPGMSVKVADLDMDPMILAVENGTVDLRSGKLRDSSASDLCTKRAAVSFDPDAECPRWLDHVKLVTGGNPELTAYLQRAAGYSLTGLVDEQTFFFLFGDGANGKNVFTETLLHMLGDYGAIAAPGLLTAAEGHPTALADLRGARMVMSDETKVGGVLNDARVKMLTGSTQVKARYMGKDFFTYDSTMKLWVLGNAKPVIRDTSAGMWRRMQLIPFTQTIPTDRRILRYEEQLREEWPGILNWALEGLMAWQAVGSLGAPNAVTDAVKTYRDEEDSFGQWMADRLEACPGGELPVPMAYQDYVTWMAFQGYLTRDVLNNVHFGRAMSTHGYDRGRTNLPASMDTDGKRGKIRFYRGARLIGSE